MKGSREIKLTTIRIPDDIKAELKHAAIDNRRSFNDELLYRLEQSLKRGVENAGRTTA